MLDFWVTLCPTFPHFSQFARDKRLSGIRLNSAMLDGSELDEELRVARANKAMPLWFDIKGRQLRIRQVIATPDHLEIVLNHPIDVELPCVVLFKAGSDNAVLSSVEDNGYRLVFDGGPHYNVKAGESICIRDPSCIVGGKTFADYEIPRLEKVIASGTVGYFLSYVESQRDVDAMREYIGPDVPLGLKIENQRGLDFVANKWVKTDNTFLFAARGDLYVELDKPHEILAALRLIIKKDPKAFVASRLLLSMVTSPVPECCDLTDLAWLYDIGYQKIMLCDELCLKPELLGRAVNVLEAFRKSLEFTKIQSRWWDRLWDLVG